MTYYHPLLHGKVEVAFAVQIQFDPSGPTIQNHEVYG